MLNKYRKPVLLTKVDEALLKADAIIAGGYARFLFNYGDEGFKPIPYGDIDVWCIDEDTYEDVLNVMNDATDATYTKSPNGWHYEWCGKTYNVIRPDVRPFRDLEHLLEQFDFTVCQAAFDDSGLYVTDEFLQDVYSNTIRFDEWATIKDPVEEMARVIKYVAKGFHVHPTVLPRIFGEFADLEMQDQAAAIQSYTLYRGLAYGVQ